MLDSLPRLRVAAQLDESVRAYPAGGRAERIDRQRRVREPQCLTEVVAGRGQRRLPGKRGVVVDRSDGQRPGECALGPRVVGRVAGDPGPLDVGGAKRRPGRPVAGNETQATLEIADRPGRHVLHPGRGRSGCRRLRIRTPEYAGGDQRRSRQQGDRGRHHHPDRRGGSSFPHLGFPPGGGPAQCCSQPAGFRMGGEVSAF